MYKYRPIYTILIALCLWALFFYAAFAHEHGASDNTNACLKTLHNQKGDWCCTGDDATKLEAEAFEVAVRRNG